jgi:hypothetical protein
LLKIDIALRAYPRTLVINLDIARARLGTAFVPEPRPDDPDELADFEDRLAAGSRRVIRRNAPTTSM